MKVPFYVLGLLLRYGPQHGYKLMQMLEERISDFAKIKLPTIYYHLQKMDDQGYIRKTIDKDGNRPEKYIYTITEEGIRYYQVLYTKLLDEAYSPEFAIDGVLFYSDGTNQEVLWNKLEEKKADLAVKIDRLKKHKDRALKQIDGQGKICAELIFDHHIGHMETEYAWMDKAIKGLKN